jgi:hypothetical protein
VAIDRRLLVQAINRVAGTARGKELYSELAALGWWWGSTRESIDRAKRYAKQSPHRRQIRNLLSKLYDLEFVEYRRLRKAKRGEQDGQALPPAGVDGTEDTHPDTQLPTGVEAPRRGSPFMG